MSRLVTDLRKVGALALLLFVLAAAVAGYPLYAYFADRAPPLWPSAALVTFAWAGFRVVEGILRLDRTPPRARRASVTTSLGVLLLALCHIGLERWTVLTPEGWPRERIQTGFDTRDWSLTPEAREFLAREGPNMRASDELMLAFGAYDQGKTYLIWKSETIFAAGVLLIVFHVFGITALSSGLVGLARARTRALGSARGTPQWERARAAPTDATIPEAHGAQVPRRLIVIVPSIAGRVASWEGLLARLQAEPELAGARFLRWDHGQHFRSRTSARALALSLCARVDAELAKSGPFEDIVLVGHSLGGLVVRQAYLFACGVEPLVCQARAWSGRISRIALFAALNRGVASEGKGANPLFRLASVLVALFPRLDRFLAFQLLQGSDFLTNLRIEWIVGSPGTELEFAL